MKVLAIGGSPEDIAFGCGGMLMKASLLGHQVALCTVTIRDNDNADFKDAQNVAKIIGASSVMVGGFQNLTHNVTSELIGFLENCIVNFDPELILTQFRNDIRHDCEAIATATLEAGRFYSNILAYETPFAKNFYPKIYYDISETIDMKDELLNACAPRESSGYQNAARGLAEFRALQSRLNTTIKYVEGFEVLKICLDTDFRLQKVPLSSTKNAISPKQGASNVRTKTSEGREGDIVVDRFVPS